MKAKTFLLIALSSLFVVACNKKSDEKDEPTSPSSQEETFTKITEDQLKSYFPYAVNDEIIFRCEFVSVEDIIFRVDDYSFTDKAGKMTVSVSFKGRQGYTARTESINIALKTEVTDNKILQMNSYYELINMPYDTKVSGIYTYDASKNDSLPEKISLSDVATVKQDIGLSYYVDNDGYQWYFLKRK